MNYYQKVIDAVFNYWVSPHCNEPRIQSWADYSGGVRAAMNEMMESQGGGKTLGVFTSGGTIATIVAHVLGVDGVQVYKFYEPLVNCSITRILYSGDRMSLSSFNDHLFIQSLASKTGGLACTDTFSTKPALQTAGMFWMPT